MTLAARARVAEVSNGGSRVAQPAAGEVEDRWNVIGDTLLDAEGLGRDEPGGTPRGDVEVVVGAGVEAPHAAK